MKQMREVFREQFPFLCALPALLWQGFFLFTPLLVIAAFSFLNFSAASLWSIITFENYARILEAIYLKIIFNSFVLAFLTVLITLLIAYPVAYFIAFKVRRFRMLLLFLIIVPSWTNIVIQVYAWFFLLEKDGLISRFISLIGLTAEPISILNSFASTVIGMVYCFLPFMILPIYTVLEKMDKKLLEASADLGAHWFYTFRRIILPLSLPGVYAGLLLVGIPAFGEFAIPALLGGGKKAYWGSLIVQKFLFLQDWASGFALACLGIFFIVTFIVVLYGLLFLYKKLFIRDVMKIGSSLDKVS